MANEQQLPDVPSGTVGGAAGKILSLIDPEEPVETAVEEEPSEQVEETEGAPEGDSEQPEKASDTPEDESTESESIQTLSELADHNEVDIDYLKSLKVQTKVDGVEGETTIDNLIREFQLGQNATRKSQEVAEQRKAFEAEAQKQAEQLQGQLQQAAQLTQFLESELTKEVEGVDWNTLRQDDPAEFAAKKQELNERAQMLAQIKQGAQGLSRDQFIERGQKEMADNIKRLPEVIPEWSDTETQKKEMAELHDYLLSNYSYTKEQIEGKMGADGKPEVYGLMHADTISIGRKAMLYDRLAKEAKPKKEKLKKLPKMGSGKPKAKDEINAEVSKSRRARLKKSNRIEDAASVLKDMFGG